MHFAMYYTKLSLKHLLLVLCMMAAQFLGAQRISLAYIDSDYILSRMPEYESAPQQLNEIAKSWEKEALGLETELKQMQRDYSAEEILLTASQKKEKQNAINSKEEELVKFRVEKFGTEGGLTQAFDQELLHNLQQLLVGQIFLRNDVLSWILPLYPYRWAH